jgi:MFS family permease
MDDTPANETHRPPATGMAMLSDRAAGFRLLGRALAHRNYRLFFAGQFVSLIGTWMTRVATGWLVFRLSAPEKAALLLGIVSFAGQIPTFFLAPFAGVLVDRWNRHRLLVATQTLSLLQSALLALVAFAAEEGATTILLVAILNLFQGVVNAFDMPGRQTFLVEMVDRREDLANAIALNSSLVNGARLLGPSVAGMLIYLAGQEGWCFVVDAISYLAVILALLAMRITARERPQQRTPLWRGLAEGFSYAFGFAPIRAILLLLALVSFMGMPYSVLMPLFARRLEGGSEVFGFLMSASGIGALIGALFLASRTTVLGLGRTIVIATSTFGVGLIGFALSEMLWLSLALLLLAGFGMMVEMAASNTILQTIVEENKRGRVMSFYAVAFMGMTPLGSLFAGVLADAIGPVRTVLVGGIACLVGAFLFALKLPALRNQVRPIYVKMGILPEVASGLRAATDMTVPPER